MKISAALVVLFAGHVALADKDKDRADALFNQGKKLLAGKHFADACQAFEQSYKLDPGIGGELNIAKCYEEWGKLARAYHAYQAAEQQARDAHDKRATKIHALVEQISSQVPRLTIHLPDGASPDNLAVTIDGAAIDGLNQPQLVDPGPHQIEYEVDGAKKTKIVPVERGGSSDVTLDLPTKKVTTTSTKTRTEKREAPEKPREIADPGDPGHGQKLAAYVTTGAGVVAIGISSYLTLSARSKYNDALAADCGGMTNGCNQAGLDATHAARHEANIATVVFLGGVAAVGVGVALYLTAPHARPRDEHALYVVPTATSGGAGLVFGGRL